MAELKEININCFVCGKAVKLAHASKQYDTGDDLTAETVVVHGVRAYGFTPAFSEVGQQEYSFCICEDCLLERLEAPDPMDPVGEYSTTDRFVEIVEDPFASEDDMVVSGSSLPAPAPAKAEPESKGKRSASPRGEEAPASASPAPVNKEPRTVRTSSRA